MSEKTYLVIDTTQLTAQDATAEPIRFEAIEREESITAALDRAAVIASDALDKQRAEYEVRLEKLREAVRSAEQRELVALAGLDERTAQLAEANATIAHLRKAKDCYYDCVDKAEANQRIAGAQKAAMDIARPMVEKAEAKAARLCGQIDDAVGELAKANGVNASLRAALEQVEWVHNAYEDMMCPWCGAEQDYHNGHKPTCARQSALEPAREGKQLTRSFMSLEFKRELEALINRHSIENNSNTPDFILCEYLITALSAFERAVNAREKWSGREADKQTIAESLGPRAAVLGFAAWLTAREKSIVFGASYSSAPAVELVKEFCDANGFDELPEGWEASLRHPA